MSLWSCDGQGNGEFAAYSAADSALIEGLYQHHIAGGPAQTPPQTLSGLRFGHTGPSDARPPNPHWEKQGQGESSWGDLEHFFWAYNS